MMRRVLFAAAAVSLLALPSPAQSKRKLAVDDIFQMLSVRDPRICPRRPRVTRPSYQKDRYERYLAWYGKHVKG